MNISTADRIKKEASSISRLRCRHFHTTSHSLGLLMLVTCSTSAISLSYAAVKQKSLSTILLQLDFWTCRLASGLWKRGMDAADAVDYDALCNVIQDLRC
jgi:hypothetical protein